MPQFVMIFKAVLINERANTEWKERRSSDEEVGEDTVGRTHVLADCHRWLHQSRPSGQLAIVRYHEARSTVHSALFSNYNLSVIVRRGMLAILYVSSVRHEEVDDQVNVARKSSYWNPLTKPFYGSFPVMSLVEYSHKRIHNFFLLVLTTKPFYGSFPVVFLLGYSHKRIHDFCISLFNYIIRFLSTINQQNVSTFLSWISFF